jgi:hypothetical protein
MNFKKPIYKGDFSEIDYERKEKRKKGFEKREEFIVSG